MNLAMIEREMATAKRTLLFLSDSISQCAVERYLAELETRRMLCAHGPVGAVAERGAAAGRAAAAGQPGARGPLPRTRSGEGRYAR